jgi:hypothetical protein
LCASWAMGFGDVIAASLVSGSMLLFRNAF